MKPRPMELRMRIRHLGKHLNFAGMPYQSSDDRFDDTPVLTRKYLFRYMVTDPIPLFREVSCRDSQTAPPAGFPVRYSAPVHTIHACLDSGLVEPRLGA